MALFHQNHDTTMSILDVLKVIYFAIGWSIMWGIHLDFFRLKQIQEICDVVMIDLMVDWVSTL